MSDLPNSSSRLFIRVAHGGVDLIVRHRHKLRGMPRGWQSLTTSAPQSSTFTGSSGQLAFIILFDMAAML